MGVEVAFSKKFSSNGKFYYKLISEGDFNVNFKDYFFLSKKSSETMSEPIVKGIVESVKLEKDGDQYGLGKSKYYSINLQ
jgi:hypothetical protein